ncbi:drug/metabolite transporter (DMT)-like permease [Microbacterium terrae]|uniref:EamA-like transporter family protein n=1 Tax=Microbacterium terrae TaxID=69369 RepID=A0A0M2GX88_9MICO|nr:DMT family transporter [Microbacterium terrae]KJL38364.1 EamA-like transporter family protein [Microbacterium terrae]MBP1078995.1 drug/metabolite transporter (DMT)-like permease [Microbacterium terrae]
MRSLRHVGVQAALASAVLFGAGTPFAKVLLGDVSPWLLAGLLYTGSGIGLIAWRLVRRAPRVRLQARELPPLIGAVFFGGLVAPVLLMAGLANMPASGASLLLNAEAVFTAMLAWFVFRENFDRRIALGMIAIVAGAIVLSVPTGATFGSPWPALAVLGACLCWGLDNNLTRKVALNDATWLAAVKGAVAGPVNLALAFLLGATLPGPWVVGGAMLVGFFAYGVSLALFIVGMRHIGTARAGAYFSVAPFFGAVIAVAFGEPITVPLLVAAALMGLGVWLHLTERHEHEHTHEPMIHDHWHTHDEHHQHEHPDGELVPAGGWHRHEHEHAELTHTHEHYPDAHHRHNH